MIVLNSVPAPSHAWIQTYPTSRHNGVKEDCNVKKQDAFLQKKSRVQQWIELHRGF